MKYFKTPITQALPLGLLLFFAPIWLNAQVPNTLPTIQLSTISETTWFTKASLSAADLNILYFLSPECPLCHSYSLQIKQLEKQLSTAYPDQQVQHVGIFPGVFYSQEEIQHYVDSFQLQQLQIILDPEMQLTHYLNASITPEAFVISNKGEVVYSGAIDNWIISLGRKRLKASRHFLSDAIDRYYLGLPAQPARTEAIGCLIE